MFCWEGGLWSGFDPAGTAVGKESLSGDRECKRNKIKVDLQNKFSSDLVMHLFKNGGLKRGRI